MQPVQRKPGSVVAPKQTQERQKSAMDLVNEQLNASVTPEVIAEELDSLRHVSKYLWTHAELDKVTRLRLVPYKHDMTSLGFIKAPFHYNVMPGGILCPAVLNGEPCPICNAAEKARANGSKEHMELWKKLRYNMRYYAMVVVKSPDGKQIFDAAPKFWGFSSNLYEELLGYVNNPEYGNIMDLRKGTDFNVSYSKKGGEKFPKPTITPCRFPTALTESDEEFAAIWEAVPDFFQDVYQLLSADEIEEKLRVFLNPEAEEMTEQMSSQLNNNVVVPDEQEAADVASVLNALKS